MKMPTNKPNVLFLETGSSGQGGSFKSLKEHIEILRHLMGGVVVILVNDSVFENDYCKLGCKVIKIEHPLYTQNSKWLRIYNKLFSGGLRLNSNLALYIQILFEWGFSNKISRIVTKYQISKLYLNNQPMRNFAGFIVAKKTKVPVISHMRTLNTYGFVAPIVDYVIGCNPKFVAISKAVKQCWCDKGIGEDMVSVIYNPVPVHAPFYVKKKKYDLIYVGRLVEGKGVDGLISAVSILSVNRSLRLAVVGDGPLRTYLERQVVSLHLTDCVEFLGYRENVVDFISDAKILVLPTRNEGFGRVIVEAMKLKVAVIASNVGGVSELIKSNQTGFLCDLNFKMDLVNKISILLGDEVLYRSFIDNAYKNACANFSADLYQNKMVVLTK